MDVVYFDTESTDLHASWGRVLCATFAFNHNPPYTLRGDHYVGKTTVDDSRLVKAIKDEIECADILVGWNSILHDVPLLNARLAKVDEPPIQLGEKHGILHLDLMYYAGGQSMKIGGKSLDKVAKYFQCDNQKTPLDGDKWQLAATGDKRALDEIVQHCEADVEVLREVTPKLLPYVKKFQFTLSEIYPFIQHIPSRSK